MSRANGADGDRGTLADILEAVGARAARALSSDEPADWRAALEQIVQRVRAAAEVGDPIPAVDDDVTADVTRPVEESVVGFDAARLVESVAETLGGRMGDRPVELVSLVAEDVPRAVAGPPGTVRRVLVELLDNALRFTDTGAVTVECGWVDGLRLIVRDTGPGIPPIEQERLFEAPHRPHGGIWRSRAGQGMGLALSRSLVEGLGGRITVRSRLGGGTTFEVWLPLTAVDTAEPPLPDRIEGRVLLVEDDDRLRAGLARSLEDLGFLVDEASDGRAALRVARRATGTYDLALLDAELDDAPGDALADLIGDRPSLRGVPRIAMTRSADLDGLQVRKPVTRWRLERAVERALGRRLSRRTAEDTPARAGKRRVLVVDDNPDSRQLAARALEAQHYRVDVATDGVEAVQAAAEVPYDLILMDIEMPRLGGLDATRRIRRAEKAGHRVPIVALTAHDDVDFRSRCIEAGMDDHVARPVRADSLLRAAERALGVVADTGSAPPAVSPTDVADPLGALPPIELDADLLDLLPDFLENRRADVRALRSWLAGGEVDARGIAHGLKGVGGAYGFPAITALGAMVGEAARAGDKARAARCVDRLAEHLGDIGRALAAGGSQP